MAAILDLHLKTTFGDVVYGTVESGTPENMDIAFGISFLAHSYSEINVLPVWRLPSWIC